MPLELHNVKGTYRIPEHANFKQSFFMQFQKSIKNHQVLAIYANNTICSQKYKNNYTNLLKL